MNDYLDILLVLAIVAGVLLAWAIQIGDEATRFIDDEG